MGKENKSRYALLGMLSLAPMSGYDLKKAIEHSVGNFWHESYPQIYPMLKQLTQEGLTTSLVEKKSGRPDRHIYALTDEGWNTLRHWLSEPFESQVQRNELLLKLFFGLHTSVTMNVEHIRRHRMIQEELLHVCERTEANLIVEWAGYPQLPYWLLTLHYGKHVTQAALAWCDEALDVLEHIETTENLSPAGENTQSVR